MGIVAHHGGASKQPRVQKFDSGQAALAKLLYLEDLSSGQRWTTPKRVITAKDVAEFAGLTGDHTPLHDDEPGENPFGRPVVHGLLGMSILAGLSSECPRVKTLALVSMGAWEFRRPIYFGDTVYAEVEIVLVEPYGRKAGRIYWRRRLLGNDDQVFQEGEMETLVARRTALPREAVSLDYSTASAGNGRGKSS